MFVIVEQPVVAGTRGQDGTEAKPGLGETQRIDAASLWLEGIDVAAVQSTPERQGAANVLHPTACLSASWQMLAPRGWMEAADWPNSEVE